VSKVDLTWKVPRSYNPDKIEDLFRDIAEQINGISEGRQSAYYLSRTSQPTTGKWALGDLVKNSSPSELGTVTGKYVISGWVCVTSGEPGTWHEMRVLTGN
jgi:hypothetical protein